MRKRAVIAVRAAARTVAGAGMSGRGRFGGPCRLAWLVALCACGALSAYGGDLPAARFHITPERPYVGQPFEIRLEVEVTPGAEVQDMRIDGIPLDACATLGAYRKEDRRQIRHGDRTVDIVPLVASGRAPQPVRQEFHGHLFANLVERHSSGFFSSLSSVSAAVLLDPLLVEFRPLPTANVPAGFQGAVGVFHLTGKVDPAQAAPGDIVNLTYTATGNGWLGAAQIILPQPDPNFRVYPPQETVRDENRQLALRQVVVPMNTNATRIGVAHFPYFDPAAGVYREATAGPFQLTLVSPQAVGSVPAVKHFDVQPVPPTSAEAGDAAMTATMSQAQHLVPFAVVFLLAVLVTVVWYEWRPRLAILAGVVVFTAGVYLCQRGSGQTRPHNREVCELATARICPSANARALFHISPGRQVTPIEASEEWVRVDFDGRRGWIPLRALKP